MSEFITIPKFLRKSSPVFKHFLDIEEMTYEGMLKERIISLTTLEKGQKGQILMISMIQKQETDTWLAFQELVSGLLAAVEPKLHGIYRFELLSIHMTEKMERFQRAEFIQGMTELALGMNVGKPQFVQYCSMLGILTKYEMEDYGKIVFRPQTQILDYKPEELNVPLERLIAASQTGPQLPGVKRLIFYDLSRNPLYDPRNKQQAEALLRMGRKYDRDLSTVLSEISVIDQIGRHLLFQRSQLELF